MGCAFKGGFWETEHQWKVEHSKLDPPYIRPRYIPRDEPRERRCAECGHVQLLVDGEWRSMEPTVLTAITNAVLKGIRR